MPEEFPSVLFIDDKEEQLRALGQQLREFGELKVATSIPDEIEAASLDGVDLVLIDLDLKRKDSPILSPTDGVALASVLRRRVVQSGRERPIGFALLSGELRDLAFPLPDSERKPLLAAQHNLEWVFAKLEDHWINHVSSLARAIHRIPKQWADGIDDVSEIAPQLGVAGAKDADRVWQIVEDFRPPIYEFTSWSHGVAFIRWLAQTALPYPTFLWDSHRVAARWRVSQPAFEKAYNESESLRLFFEPAEYRGLLHDFDGMRWWRHRIEQQVWDNTEGNSQDAKVLRRVIFDKAKQELEPTQQEHPIVTIGADARPISPFVRVEDAVRVQPDGWPPRADTAWMLRSLIKEKPHLRKLVIEEDREKLPPLAAHA